MSFAISRDQQSLAGMVFNTLPVAPFNAAARYLHIHLGVDCELGNESRAAAPFRACCDMGTGRQVCRSCAMRAQAAQKRKDKSIHDQARAVALGAWR